MIPVKGPELLKERVILLFEAMEREMILTGLATEILWRLQPVHNRETRAAITHMTVRDRRCWPL